MKEMVVSDNGTLSTSNDRNAGSVMLCLGVAPERRFIIMPSLFSTTS